MEHSCGIRNIYHNQISIIMNEHSLSVELFLLSTMLFLSLISLPTSIVATTGLRVIVHVNDSGSVCVSSFSQDLPCQFIRGPNEVTFQFSPGMVDVNEEFEACIDDFCKYGINGPESQPEDIYLFRAAEMEGDNVYSTGNIEENNNSQKFGPVFLVGFVILVALILVIKFRGKKYNKRQYFPQYVKKEVLNKQGYKCAICKRSAGVWDYDHIDGNSANNDVSNCQALCPNCHAKKTRGLILVKRKRNYQLLRKYISIIVVFILLVIGYFLLVN